jgi:hypothetical protein
MNYKYSEIEAHFDDWLTETLEHQGTEWVKDNLDDLHHECFNTDYYIIGTQQAIDWMGSNAFRIIQFVKEYEEDNFGECGTDLSDPETCGQYVRLHHWRGNRSVSTSWNRRPRDAKLSCYPNQGRAVLLRKRELRGLSKANCSGFRAIL